MHVNMACSNPNSNCTCPQGRTIKKVILSVSEHPNQLVKMTWEGLYVALSRVRFSDDIRLLVRRGDRTTMNYITQLKKNQSIKSFFKGYRGPMPMQWDGRIAAALMQDLCRPNHNV